MPEVIAHAEFRGEQSNRTCLFYLQLFTITGRKFSNADLLAKVFMLLHVNADGAQRNA